LGGLSVGGHHGLEPATVLPMLPPKDISLPALMISSLRRRPRLIRRFALDAATTAFGDGIAGNDNPNYDYD
jgi:hypothetical protein